MVGFHWSWELSLKNQPEEDAAEAKPGSRRTSSGSHECHSPRVLRTRNLKSDWFFIDTSPQDDWFFNDTHWQATNWPGGDAEFPKGGGESRALRPPPGRRNGMARPGIGLQPVSLKNHTIFCRVSIKDQSSSRFRGLRRRCLALLAEPRMQQPRRPGDPLALPPPTGWFFNDNLENQSRGAKRTRPEAAHLGAERRGTWAHPPTTPVDSKFSRCCTHAAPKMEM